MTETLEHPEAQKADLKTLLDQWAETPPPNLFAALQEQGISPESLEEHARSGISADEAATLHRVLVHGATTGEAENAALLARMLPILDPRERAWDRVLKAKSTGEVLSATVTEATKGGVVVDLGIRGFVPSSQIGLSVPRNLTQFVGRTLKLRVMEVDRRRQTVVLTNRQIMEEERAEKRKSALSRIEEGEERSGTVRRITDIGAFVDVGGVDGLLHVSEIAWRRVEHPSEVLKVGEKVNVKVLRVDPAAGRVSLSMRRLIPDPWEEARRKYAPGTPVNVKIARIVPQGAVVELEGDLEGWLPISELADRRVNAPEEVVQVDQEVEALVIDLQPRDRRIVLSLRKLEQKRDRQVLEQVQRKSRASDHRTTLGDLFGHLFQELQQPEEAAAPAASEAAAGEATDESSTPVAAAVDTDDTEADAQTPDVNTEAPAAAEPEIVVGEEPTDAADETEAPALPEQDAASDGDAPAAEGDAETIAAEGDAESIAADADETEQVAVGAPTDGDGETRERENPSA